MFIYVYLVYRILLKITNNDFPWAIRKQCLFIIFPFCQKSRKTLFLFLFLFYFFIFFFLFTSLNPSKCFFLRTYIPYRLNLFLLVSLTNFSFSSAIYNKTTHVWVFIFIVFTSALLRGRDFLIWRCSYISVTSRFVCCLAL